MSLVPGLQWDGSLPDCLLPIEDDRAQLTRWIEVMNDAAADEESAAADMDDFRFRALLQARADAFRRIGLALGEYRDEHFPEAP